MAEEENVKTYSYTVKHLSKYFEVRLTEFAYDLLWCIKKFENVGRIF